MKQLITQLRIKYPTLKFRSGDQFSWSPETKEIIYKSSSGKNATWSLLHETGHALLGHQSYKADFELVRLEIDAWQKAREVAHELDITISEDHIEDCLDTYRDWLYKRSICPNCGTKSVQQDDYIHYRCFNCSTVWKVTASRFCRAYRSTKNVVQPSTLHLSNNLG